MRITARRWGTPLLLSALLVGLVPGAVRAATPVAVDDPVPACQGGPLFGGGSFPIPEDWKGGSPAAFASYFAFIGGLSCSPLSNDTDADHDPLTIASVTDGPHGHVIAIDPTSVAYEPDPDWSTPVGDWVSDTFTYTATDGTEVSAPATMHIWLAPINDPPTFTPGPTVTVAENAGPYSGAWATDVSPGPPNESDQNISFHVTDVDDDGLGLFSSAPTISSDGTLSFTPATDAKGIAEVTVEAKDDGGLEDWDMNPAWIDPPDDTSDPVTFEIIVTDAPDAVDDPSATTSEDTQAILHVLDNDDANGAATIKVTAVSDPAKGVATIIQAGLYVRYTPDPNANGIDTFTYTVNGGDTATVTIAIMPINDPPSFTHGSTDLQGTEDVSASFPAWAPPASMSPGSPDESAQTLHFVVTANDDPALFAQGPSVSATTGKLTWKPAANAHGVAHVTIRLLDSGGVANGGQDRSGPVTLTITVDPVDDPPVAVADSVTVTEDDTSATTVDVLGNDTDIDGDALTVTARTNGSKGTVAISPGGTGVTYQPLTNKSGSDSFTYTVSDGHGGTATATVSVTITPTNDVPNAVNDQATVNEGDGPKVITVLGNDQDLDGDVLKITAVTNGSLGTVAITGGGTGLTYDPKPLASGSDTFTYTVSDGHGGSDTATVLVTITPDTAVPVLSSLKQGIAAQTLATNTANTTKVDLTWAGSDPGSGVTSYLLQASVDGGPFSSISLSSPTATTSTRTLTVGRTYQFRVRATDGEGNVSGYALWPTITPGRHQETSSLVTYTGTWTAVANANKSGGSSRSVASTAARARFAFTGRDVGWVATRGTAGGRAAVYLDGVKIATIDLYASTAQYRIMVLRWHFSTKAAHVLELRPLGDGPIDLDAFIVLR